MVFLIISWTLTLFFFSSAHAYGIFSQFLGEEAFSSESGTTIIWNKPFLSVLIFYALFLLLFDKAVREGIKSQGLDD